MEGKTSQLFTCPLDQKTPCGVVSGAVWQLLLCFGHIPLVAYLHHACHARLCSSYTATVEGRPSPHLCGLLSHNSTQGALFPFPIFSWHTVCWLFILWLKGSTQWSIILCQHKRKYQGSCVQSDQRRGTFLKCFAKVTWSRLVQWYLLTVQIFIPSLAWCIAVCSLPCLFFPFFLSFLKKNFF